MAHRTLVLALLVLIGPLVPSSATAGTFLSRQLKAPRVRAALHARGGDVRDAFLRADAAWPPRGLFLRGFKLEGVLEVWAGHRTEDRSVRIWTLPLCDLSGDLGPKRREGDGQTPEGFYRIDRFNPRSSYHLSLGLNYPNAVDRARTPGGDPGSDIFVHGSCVTIGCLTIEDEPIERVYLAAVMARDRGQRHLPVHLFPCRFGQSRCEDALGDRGRTRPDLVAFWDTLRSAYQVFESSRTVPDVRATRSGYRLR